MSSNIIHEWFYQLKGKKLQLYKLLRGGYAPTNKGEFLRGRDKYIYPDEAISSGLRIEYTALISPFVDKDPSVLDEGANPTLVEHTVGNSTASNRVTENSHVNLNRMQSLAIVDYLKAMLKEQEGEIEAKEYYMKQFYKKLGDNESNKRKISMSFPSNPYAVR